MHELRGKKYSIFLPGDVVVLMERERELGEKNTSALIARLIRQASKYETKVIVELKEKEG